MGPALDMIFSLDYTINFLAHMGGKEDRSGMLVWGLLPTKTASLPANLQLNSQHDRLLSLRMNKFCLVYGLHSSAFQLDKRKLHNKREFCATKCQKFHSHLRYFFSLLHTRKAVVPGEGAGARSAAPAINPHFQNSLCFFAANRLQYICKL